ncbi:P-loop containing nucleoside triphosphate hydrolase protein [Dothidotthia symphoricarpi CBS 119687]|uniref:P-loop containing nucleoside triphosphate hydrolase protein n=1 Tax=Dothidotthia symphoricarpi CBS 119687 TaxID=1392245 RepID=A0A6A5ZVN2_9PLEO|nr:P-loop containing nucleoside triphosphate hydrolase protein [Dothidotthia symphoricarpi CBS 119687]KAF2123589.1 P-loop containing nucleoside triphosphate hydrolase protein [Dothidotthia symphoricarpi CBS 119687]
MVDTRLDMLVDRLEAARMKLSNLNLAREDGAALDDPVYRDLIGELSSVQKDYFKFIEQDDQERLAVAEMQVSYQKKQEAEENHKTIQLLREEQLARGSCVRAVVVFKPSSPNANPTLHIEDNNTIALGSESYTFDRIFNPGFKINDISQYLEHTCGPSGTGKTRLMIRGEDEGVATSLVCNMVNRYTSNASIKYQGTWSAKGSVTLKVIEVYNNRLSDFLVQTIPGSKDSNSGVKILGSSFYKDEAGSHPITERNVKQPQDLQSTLTEINKFRASKPTRQNPTGSSRSHLLLIFTLNLEHRSSGLVFVDLAGTEAVDAAPSDGKGQSSGQESKKINQEGSHIRDDLYQLRAVIRTLNKKAPYNDGNRKLLAALKPYLQSTHVTYVVTAALDGQVKPLQETLKHAVEAMRVKAKET